MATFTSVISGLWNDGATWGMTSPGVKGTDWPGTAGDVVNIGTTAGQAHTVTYNVSETNELGQITIGATTGTARSVLYFKRDANTKLTMSHNNILIQQTGSLDLGQTGDLVAASNTAEILFNTTGDNQKGISCPNAGGKLYTADNPAYYGSLVKATLQANWTSGTTLYTTEDVSSKWQSGQTIYIHKGALYSNYNTDTFKATINGAPSWDGTKSTIVITEAHPGGTFTAGGYIVNASRNVQISKFGANVTVGQYNTNRPFCTFVNTAGNPFNEIGGAWTGFYAISIKYSGDYASSTVIRNGVIGLIGAGSGEIYEVTYRGMIISVQVCMQYLNTGTVSGYILCGSTVFSGCTNFTNSADCYSNSVVHFQNFNVTITGSLFGNLYAVQNCNLMYLNGYFFYNNQMSRGSTKVIVTGSVGYDPAGTSKPNSIDVHYAITSNVPYSDVLYKNAKNTTPIISIVNAALTSYGGFVKIEDYNRTLNDHRKYDAFGKIESDPSVVRTGGASTSIKVTPSSGCSTYNIIDILGHFVESNVPVGSHTRSVKILGTGWGSTFPANTELYLEAEYYTGSGNATTTAVSTAVLADNTTWHDFPVTFTQGLAGKVTYKIYLKKYVASAFISIDNCLYRTGLGTIQGKWLEGESHIMADYTDGTGTGATGTGTISGTIRDSSGNVIDCSVYNVRVNAYAKGNQFGSPTATTLVMASDGSWSISTLVAATKYLVTFEYEGSYSPLDQTDIAGAELLTAA